MGENQGLVVLQRGEGRTVPQGQLLAIHNHGRCVPFHADLGGGQAHPEGIPDGESLCAAAPAGNEPNSPQLGACAGGGLVGRESKGGGSVCIQRDIQGLGRGILNGEKQVLHIQVVGRGVGKGQLNRWGH